MIQTVGDSSDSSCVSTDPSPMNSFFSLSTLVPSTCEAQVVTWNETRYQTAPNVRVLIPGGPALTLKAPTSTSITWQVDMRAGSQAVVFVESDSRGELNANSRTSPLITVTASQDDYCLLFGELKSTAILSNVTASTTALPVSTITASIPGLPESTKKVK